MIDFIKDNWTTIRKKPLPFFIVFVIGLTTGVPGSWFLINWRHETLRESDKTAHSSSLSSQRERFEGEAAVTVQRIEALKERILVKDEQLNEYRERFKIETATATKYSLMTNKELADSASTFLAKFQRFITKERESDNRFPVRMVSESSEPV